MSDEKKKSEKSKLVKILGGLAVAGVIAYNGWVVWYNAEGSVRSATKELLTELIPQSLDEEVVEFVEVENFKIDSTAKHKWAGEANAKVKVKESGKIGNIRFTFDVEEKKEDKGEMVYVQNLLADEASAVELLGRETESVEDEVKTNGRGSQDMGKPEITDLSAHVAALKERAENMTTLQQSELREKEEGRTVEVVIKVIDVHKEEYSDDGKSVDVACIDASSGISVVVPNIKNTASAYKKAIGLVKGTRAKVVGILCYTKGILVLDWDKPMVVATKLEIVEDVEDGL